MIQIKPFKAYRPDPVYVAQVAALPYDVVSEEEARRIGKSNPYSFLHVDKPEVFCEGMKDERDCYKAAGRCLDEMIDSGIFIQEDEPCLYIYGLENEYGEQYGIVGCLSCKQYDMGKIKKHEKTREDKEKDRILHIEGCRAHTGPIFLACKEDNIECLIKAYKKGHTPIYDFIHEDVRQVIYRIKEQEDIEKAMNCFKEMDALYVADGHHRLAAAASHAQARRREEATREDKGEMRQEEEYEDFLGVVFPKSCLRIMDYNRIIKDESGLNKEELIKVIGEHFNIEVMQDRVYQPLQAHCIGMRYRGDWYKLSLKENQVKRTDTAARLDTQVLQDLILEPIFHIKNPRTDKRIEFIGGIKGIEELNRRTDEDMDIAFSLYPTTIDELIQVADEEGLMPPKSTWFEPKLRSGLFIHRF